MREQCKPPLRDRSPGAPRCRTRLWLVSLLGIVLWAPALQAAGGEAVADGQEGLTAPVGGEAGLVETERIVRLYYGDAVRLAQLVDRYDVFEYANHEAGYVVARLRPAEYAELTQAGYRMEIDEFQTASVRRVTPQVQGSGIPAFPCYRTVEETLTALGQIAERRPDLATLVDIGESWDKLTPGGAAGYDLLVLVLSNGSVPGPKPKLFLMAEHHARELVTAETALRFAEELVAGYGVDPDITWLLDFQEVHMLPMSNPDGRKWAEQGLWWRKNTDNDDGCTASTGYGTDLNRNCGFKWGGNGSSGFACDETYRGPAAHSEPENQAMGDYVRSLFADQRGPGDTDPAPEDASGLLLSLHSYGELVLFPWGWTAKAAPNHAALRTLGCKFGFFNRHTVQPSVALYATSGTADDWAYGELGLAAYTFEMGTTFFQPCADFEEHIYPSNRLALLYACKACRQPYLVAAGPDVLQVVVSPPTNLIGARFDVAAIVCHGRYAGATPPPPTHLIAAARYSVDVPSWYPGAVTQVMDLADVAAGSSNQTVLATIETTGWAVGRHTVFVEAQDATGSWGVPTAQFVWVEPLLITGAIGAEGLVLRWPGMGHRLDTLWHTDDWRHPFSILASNLTAHPPWNTYTDDVRVAGTRFYRVQAGASGSDRASRK